MLEVGCWRLDRADSNLRFVAHYEHHFHAGVMESFTPSE